MRLLLSNMPPLNNNFDFTDAYEDLIQDAETIKIACGYISTEGLVELKKTIEDNNKRNVNVIIGMHYFEGFTRVQHEAAVFLNNFLLKTNSGAVYLTTAFKYHGKMYYFENSKNRTCIIGSSNLDATQPGHYNFETDLLVDEENITVEIGSFFEQLKEKACTEISKCSNIKYVSRNPLLEKHYAVKKFTNEEKAQVLDSFTNVRIEIPVKSDEAQQSNLNAYFGKGRVNQRGYVKPRHWYEVELIVPREITIDDNYPKENDVITVYTDDNWIFKCKISGDYGKNLRSESDLRILGKWLKGRLENEGCLKVGELVTGKSLEKYGRNTITMTKLKLENSWYFDFGVK